MMSRSKEGKGIGYAGKDPFATWTPTTKPIASQPGEPPSPPASHIPSHAGSRQGDVDVPSSSTMPQTSGQPLTQEALAEWHKQQVEMYNKIMSGGTPAVPVEPPPGIKAEGHEEFDIDKGKTEDSNPASVRLAPIASKLLPIDLDDDEVSDLVDKKEQEDKKNKEKEKKIQSKEDQEDLREVRDQL